MADRARRADLRRARRRARWLPPVLLAVVAAAVVAGLAVIGRLLAGGAPAPADDGPPSALASVSGVVVERLVLTDRVDTTTGEPGPDRVRFRDGEAVVAWVAFDDTAAGADGQVLRFVWTRGTGPDAAQLLQTTVPLPQPVGHVSATLAASYTDVAGTYQVTLLVDDRELVSRSFTVGS